MTAPEPSPSEPDVSVVVVVVDRTRDIDACLQSLRAQTLRSFDVAVVLNRATPEVSRRVLQHAAEDARIRPCVTPGVTASEARNLGLRETRAPLLYFLDDDVVLSHEALERVVKLFRERPDVTIAGGPNLTPPDDPDFAQLTGEVLASRFGTGITRPRYATGSPGLAREQHLTLCNLAVRRSLFTQGFAFPTLFGGEENVLMGRAEHAGHRLWYSPDLWVWHRRRATLRGFLEQMQRYGFGRGIALLGAPRTFHVAYFVPLAWLLYLLALPALWWWSPWGALPFLLYGLLALASGLAIAVRRRRPTWVLGAAALYPALHASYALGLWRGLWRGRRDGRRRVSVVPSGST